MDEICLCRACLCTNSNEYIEMDAPFSNDKTYLDCFNSCTQLIAKSGDELPNMLCSNCAESLRNSFKFIMDARQADVLLQSRLSERHRNLSQKFEILSPKSNTFIDTDIENMEVVVIKSLEDEDIHNTLPIERLDYECCSENDGNYVLKIHDKSEISNSPDWRYSHFKRTISQCASRQHLMTCHDDLHSCKCEKCSKYSHKSLERHKSLRQKTPEKKETIREDALISCSQCNIVLTSQNMLERHEKMLHNRIPCSSNNEKISAESNELQEEKREEPSVEKKWNDDYGENLIENCEAERSDVEGFECIVLEDMDRIAEFQKCTFCKKKLLARNMGKHLKLHTTRQEDFLCAYCPRHFKNQKSVRQHEKTHFEESEDIVFVCSFCDRQYSTESLLEQHRKNTHKEREHTCTICGNSFKLRNQLTNHMKLHLEKNIKCPQCDKKYARQFDLNVHLRTHTGEMPYKCHLCEKKFAIKVRLTYHLQKHYGIKHTCKECDAQFNSKQKLKTHSFKHTGMPYRCELCDDHGFPNRDVFRRHLMRVHNAKISEEALIEMFQRYTGKTPRIREVSVSMEEEIQISPAETVDDSKSNQTDGLIA